MKNLERYTSDLVLLYVEDEEDIRKQFATTMRLLFKKVYLANDGLDGLEKYKDHVNEIDIVITDIQMPVMNGLEMSKHIKSIDEEAHIVITSAHNDFDYMVKAIEVGVDGVIIKPVHSHVLFKTLKKSAKNIEIQKENKRYKEGLEKLVVEKTRELDEYYTTDKLTGCFNRQKLDQAVHRNDFSFVMLINMDNLDSINSTYGYNIGDEVIRFFASFLKDKMTQYCELFRLAGDEFVILFYPGCVLEKATFAAEIIDSLQYKEFVVDEFVIHLSCTIGIADNDNHPDGSVLVRAHAAMKEMRQIGKNKFQIYSNSSSYIKKQRDNLNWAQKVKEALAKDLITPYFQPIVDNFTVMPVKHECLARIQEYDKIILPYYFLEPAKLVGLIPNIDNVMFEKSFTYFQNRIGDFSLNIAECDLRLKTLPKTLSELSIKYNINPNRVTLEILENISTNDCDFILEQLTELKNIGFKLALDDFGSEKSNFFRLQKLNVDYIKIDGSFIKDIDRNENSLHICKTIVDLAQVLNCDVIAEFVHSKDVFDIVKDIGIRYFQGYYFGEPSSDIAS
jgi:diguanylate cyclase (GGDEF)-like protein